MDECVTVQYSNGAINEGGNQHAIPKLTVQYSNGTLSTRVFGQRGKSSAAVRASIPAQVVSSRR